MSSYSNSRHKAPRLISSQVDLPLLLLIDRARAFAQRILLLLLLFICAGQSMLAQQTVSGIISDNDDRALPGVTVLIKGTTIGTSTDSAGFYRLSAGKGNTILFSCAGHESREVKILNDFTVNLILPVLVNNLNEVVVTGYISEKVKDITGAVAIVKPSDLTAVPAGQVVPMLQGRAAGINVITQATPGASTMISIHGYGNFGDVTPLYIIDGTPGNIDNLNPDDIESLQILKDAGSAAIYGVRGANGAIVITTRKGKPGNATINFESYLGYQVPLSKGYDLLNPQEMANATWLAYKNSGQPLTHPQYSSVAGSPLPVLPYYVLAGNLGGLAADDPAADASKYNNDPAAGQIYQIVKANQSGTDWFHELYKPAFSQNYSLTASGGSDKSRYLFSTGYLNQQGTLINTYLKRFTVRINTEFNVLNNIRIGENIQLSSREMPDYAAPENPGPFVSAATSLANPILPPLDIKGNFYSDAPGLGMPSVIRIYENTKRSRNRFWTALGNVYAEVDFAKYFTLKTQFGGTFNYNYYYYYQPSFASFNNSTDATLNEGSGYSRNWTWQNTLALRKTYNEKHTVKLLIGTEYLSNYGRSLSGSRVNFYSDDPNFSYLSNGGTTGQNNSSQAFNSALYSLFGRLDYSYQDKYLFMATIRRDGSSVFGPDNRYGIFPSFSAAWRISKENFATDISWLTDLKLRGSWGKLGFDGNTPLTNQFSLYSGNPSSSFYDIGGTNTSSAQGFNAVSIGNLKTEWQTDLQTDIGLDGIFWNNKLSFSFDWWVKRSTGLLFALALPQLLGGATAPYVNVGDMSNTGFDLMLGTQNKITKDLKFDATATLTLYKNRIEKINEGQTYFDQGITRNEVGHPASSFFGYKVIGLFSSADDVSKSPKQDDAGPGRFKYLDANLDGKISDSDRVFFGDPNPKFSLGLNIAVSYKNFDFSTFFYGVFGNDIMNTMKLATDFFPGLNAKSKAMLYDSWTPSHLNAKVPINENVTNFSNNGSSNSYAIEKGSYFRNKSMILGYSLGRNTLKNIHFKQIRIYIQVTNLFTLTKYTGLDPETAGTANYFGVDGGNYPNNQKQWLLGFNVGF